MITKGHARQVALAAYIMLMMAIGRWVGFF